MRVLVVLALVLLVFPATAQVGTPRPPTEKVTPQLEVIHVSLNTTDAPDIRDGVPAKGYVRVTLKNAGEVDVTTYTVGYQWRTADGALTWLNFDDQAQSTDTNTQGVFEKGTTRELPLVPWTPSPFQAGRGHLVVTVSYSDRAHTRTSNDPAYFVAVHDLQATVSERPLNLSASETGFFRIVVANQGNVEERLELNVTDWNRGNNSRLRTELLPAQLTIPPGRSMNTSLLLTYPFVGDRGNFTANFTVRGISATPGYRHVIVKTPLVLGRDCCMPAGHQFQATHGLTEALAARGETVRVPVRVTNTAAALAQRPDTYTVTGLPPQGWEAPEKTWTLAVVEGETQAVTVAFRVPDAATLGSTYTLLVHVRSAHDGGEKLLQTRVQVRGAAPVVQAIHIDNLWRYVGDSGRGVVELVNRGTHDYTQNAQVQVTTVLPAGASNRRSVENLTVPPVPVGSSIQVPFSLGRFTHVGVGTVTAFWHEPGADTGSALADASFKVERFELQVRPPPTALRGQPGQVVHYQSILHGFHLINNGTGPETVYVAALSTAGRAQASITEVTLQPNDNITIPVAQTLPLPANGLTTVGVTVTAAPVGRGDRLKSARIDTRIDDGQPPTLSLQPLPSNWTRGESLGVRVQASDNGAVLGVRVEHRQGKDNFTAKDLVQSASGDWVGTLTFASPGDFDVRFTARDAALNYATTAVSRIHVEDYPPPTLALVQAPPTPATRQDTLQVEVATRHPPVNVTARIGAANATALTLSNGSAELRLGDLADVRPGAQEILIEAVDASGARATLRLGVVLEEASAAPVTTTTTALATPAPSVALIFLLLLAAVCLVQPCRRRPGRGSGPAS